MLKLIQTSFLNRSVFIYFSMGTYFLRMVIKLKSIIFLFANIINELHDMLIYIFESFGIYLSDKQLHFWVMGFAGLFSFIFVDFVFKQLSKISISIISFISTFFFLIILNLNIEIQQHITGRGNMDSGDILFGMYGFLAFFMVFLLFKTVFIFVKNKFSDAKKKEAENEL